MAAVLEQSAEKTAVCNAFQRIDSQVEQSDYFRSEPALGHGPFHSYSFM